MKVKLRSWILDPCSLSLIHLSPLQPYFKPTVTILGIGHGFPQGNAENVPVEAVSIFVDIEHHICTFIMDEALCVSKRNFPHLQSHQSETEFVRRRKASSTRYPQAVSHPSPNQAQPCSASQIRQDGAYKTGPAQAGMARSHRGTNRHF